MEGVEEILLGTIPDNISRHAGEKEMKRNSHTKEETKQRRKKRGRGEMKGLGIREQKG